MASSVLYSQIVIQLLKFDLDNYIGHYFLLFTFLRMIAHKWEQNDKLGIIKKNCIVKIFNRILPNE